MRLAIMQPYFFPYIGYFQLMHSVDRFVIYDNIQYSKGGWLNRNRILANGSDVYVSLHLKKDSDYIDVRDRFLSTQFKQENLKILRKIKEAYRKAPCFTDFFPVVKKCLEFDDPNLFNFIFHSLIEITRYLSLKTDFVVSSQINCDHDLKGQERVIAICRHLGATTYINPPGGRQLYDPEAFSFSGIDLKFIEPRIISYPQFGNTFFPCLSIVDVLMFNSSERAKELIGEYSIN